MTSWLSFLASAALLPGVLGAQPRGGDGYLFKSPAASLSLRLGVGSPSASGDIFDFVAKDLTIERRDFLGLSFMADYSAMLTQRVEVQFSGGTTSRRADSEYRRFIDNNDMPIQQATTFQRSPLAVGLRLNVIPAGRRVSSLVWVPSRVVPYIAVGGGAMHYRFVQRGDFIDFQTNDVFSSKLRTSGWGALGYGALGTTFNLSSTLGWTTEARYDLSRAAVHGDFQRFGPIGLSGVGLTTGVTFRY